MKKKHGLALTSLALMSGLALTGLPSAQASQSSPSTQQKIQDLSKPQILSAAWGLNDGNMCPTGQKGLDNIPVTFNWFINPTTI
ncbi:MAG: hypothetical protein F2820_07570, partial [Actinobacteria bacterium]|nr:hypothetical protein [Actinomycetota bacterium]